MPILESDVVVGGKYRTPNNQERIVIGCNAECQVVYASRGGNVENRFDIRNVSQLSTFAGACNENIRRLSGEELQQVIETCNGQNAIEVGETCCLE